MPRDRATGCGNRAATAFFKPTHGLTPELAERYEANRLTVTRQLAHHPASTKTLDLCIFVNGLPPGVELVERSWLADAVGHLPGPLLAAIDDGLRAVLGL